MSVMVSAKFENRGSIDIHHHTYDVPEVYMNTVFLERKITLMGE